jgi:acyl-CoA reductase-like NAD-dependent aldehyde dehydrogenase
MPKYPFQYAREQRHLIVVEADNYDEAYEKAQDAVTKLNLDSPDDESDDDGELTDAETVDEET